MQGCELILSTCKFANSCKQINTGIFTCAYNYMWIVIIVKITKIKILKLVVLGWK